MKDIIGNISLLMTTTVARIAAVIIALGVNIGVLAQVDNEDGRELYMSWDDFMDEYNGEGDDGLDEEIIDLLESLHSSPLNINTASRRQLLSIPFLSSEQTDSILSYRNKKRMFRSLGELLFFKNIDYNDRRRLSLFLYAGDTLVSKQKLSLSHFFGGRHEVESRLDIPLYKRAGYKTYTHEELLNNPNKIYLGNALSNVVRYRYRNSRNGATVAYGLTLQKDAGEPFGNRGNMPYSYTSAYFHLRPAGEKYAIWVGDYNLGLSQGLLFSNMFYSSRMQVGETFGKTGLKIRPHTSTDEWCFFRGTAFSFNFGKWSLSAFASYRNIGGTLANDTITSLKTDGLYRTLAETEKKNNTGVAMGGAYASLNRNGWHVGFGGSFTSFNHTVWPNMRAYNHYYFRGRTAAGFSVDYSIGLQRWKFQGEMAVDKGLHYAMVHKIKYIPGMRMNFFLQMRAFSPRFISVWGKTLQANSRIQNEYGALLGTKANLGDNCELLAYVDYFRFPKASFRAYAPSQGCEALIQTTKGIKGGWTLLARYSIRSKQQNITGYPGTLEYASTHKFKCSASMPKKHFTLSTSIDAVAATKQSGNTEIGGMASMRLKANVTNRLNLHFFCSAFITDGYSARLYAYEPQLLYAGSFPSFYDKGTRAVLQAKWQIADGIFIAARYGILKYFNRSSISSGLQAIASSIKNDLSIQAIWRIAAKKR